MGGEAFRGAEIVAFLFASIALSGQKDRVIDLSKALPSPQRSSTPAADRADGGNVRRRRSVRAGGGEMSSTSVRGSVLEAPERFGGDIFVHMRRLRMAQVGDLDPGRPLLARIAPSGRASRQSTSTSKIRTDDRRGAWGSLAPAIARERARRSPRRHRCRESRAGGRFRWRCDRVGGITASSSKSPRV